MMGVKLKEHRTNKSIFSHAADGCMNAVLMATVAHMKCMPFRYVRRDSAGQLAFMVMEGAMKRNRSRGASTEQWLDNIREWSGPGVSKSGTSGKRPPGRG